MVFLKKLWHELTNPRVEEEGVARQEYLTRVIYTLVSAGMLIMTVIVLIINYGIGVPNNETTLIMASMDLLIVIGWYWIQKRQWHVSGYLLPFVFLMFSGYMIFMVGPITTAVLQLAIAVLLAGMLSGNRARWIMLVICLVVYVAAGWGSGERDVEVFLTSGILIFMSLCGVALLEWFFSNLLNQSLRTVREREVKLDSIFRAAPIGIGMVVNRVIQEANDTLCQMTGYAREELVGNSARMLYPAQEDYEYVGAEKYRQIHEQAIGTVETRWLRKDGLMRDILLSSVPLDSGDLSKGVTFTALDITERKQTETSLRTKTAELESLFSISSQLRVAQSADEMLPLVLAEVRRVLRSDANAVILLDPDEEHFICALGDGPLAVNVGVIFNAEKGISGLVLQTRRPYSTENLSADPKKIPSLRGDDDLGPAVFVPVISESKFIGVLLCARNKGIASDQYSSSEVQLLTAIGEMVGNALRRARLYDQALSRLQHVQALHSIDMAISANLDLSVILDVLLSQGIAQLNVDAASILLLNPYTHMLEFAAGSGFYAKEIKSTQLRLGEGLPGQAAMERQILHIPEFSVTDGLVRTYLLDEGFVSYRAVPLIAKGQLQGVLEVFNKNPIRVDDERTGFLETLATQAAIAIDNSRLFSDLQRSNFELEIAYDATIEGWSLALELRDQETEGHTLRVADMTIRLAQAMGVKDKELLHIRRGSLLHDIGKMGVPDRILLKPGELVDEEWELMKQHPIYAFEMLWPIEFLRPALDIPYCHHERWDGTGYPRQLKGEQIPLAARIFAVVDVWDALTSDRPYRDAWSEQDALEYIRTNAGKHLDPSVVEVFLDFLKENDRG